jgi:heptosyltransferase-2
LSSQGKILVIRGGAIGDFILTLPVLAALCEQFPQVKLEVLGYPHIAQLAAAGGLADEVRSIEAGALAGFFARGGKLNDDLADYFESFALVISFLYDPDLIFRTNVARCSGAQFIEGPHRPDEKLDVHATDTFLKPLEKLAIFSANPVPRLAFASDPASGERGETRWLAAHPGSGSERKNWPEGQWRELLGRVMAETDLSVLLIGGEAEEGRAARLAAGLPCPRVQLAENLPLTELARRISRCGYFLGHDSGISHLAAALGLKGLVLWGETRKEIWSPRSERFALLEAGSMLAELEVERVFLEVAGMTTDPPETAGNSV